MRQQQVDEVFALLSSLIDAAERLRQFSPVKEQLSTAVLEEVRFRLYRIVSDSRPCSDGSLPCDYILAETGHFLRAFEAKSTKATCVLMCNLAAHVQLQLLARREWTFHKTPCGAVLCRSCLDSYSALTLMLPRSSACICNAQATTSCPGLSHFVADCGRRFL